MWGGGESRNLSAMASFRFLHAADIHLDSPLKGLRARTDRADEFVGASRRAFANLVDAALESGVAFVLIAGDLYDGDWRDYSTGQFLVREVSRLTRAGVRVLSIRGNHDAASEITRALPLPTGMRELSIRKTETVLIEEIEVAIHGRGFAQRHVSENMSAAFPAARPGWFNIGMLHTSLTGREGHDVYAPCSLDDLLGCGYQYWALGHIHAREVVHADPPVVFAGNLQGRGIRETGPKGATLVRVEEGRVAGLEALELDAARWDRVTVELDREPDWRDALDRALRPAVERAAGRPLALRVRLRGATPQHAWLAADRTRLAEEVQSLASHVSDRVLVEKVELATRAPAAAAPVPLPVADLEQALAGACNDAAFRSELDAHLALIRDRAPRELAGESPVPLDSTLQAARDLILARLGEAGA